MSSANLDASGNIQLDFGGGVKVSAPLASIKMSADQKKLVEKLFGAKPGFTSDAKALNPTPGGMTEAEMKEIRGLKLQIGPVTAGLICDFGLKCVVV